MYFLSELLIKELISSFQKTLNKETSLGYTDNIIHFKKAKILLMKRSKVLSNGVCIIDALCRSRNIIYILIFH